MTSTQYICFNGKIYSEHTNIFGAENRAFKYGDSLFETIHANGTEIQFLQEHFNRLLESMAIIGMEIPDDFCNTLEMDIKYLINKNKAFSGNRIRLAVFRNSGGLYTPSDNSISYLLETSGLENHFYTLNRKGYQIGVYKDVRKSPSIISPLKTGNSLPFIMAGQYKQKMKWDDCLILNERGNLVEGISSNLFLVKDNVLMTPSLDSGAVSGVMREQIIQAALRLNLTIYEDCILTENDLMEADEIFLTNAISGIRWVVAYQDRRYFNKTSKILIEELNNYCFNN
jgi:branched-chain amino acid aminotransferase